MPFASSINSSDGSNGDRGDSRSDLSEAERAKLKEQFRMKQEQMKEQRRRKRELWADRRSKRRARKLNKQRSGAYNCLLEDQHGVTPLFIILNLRNGAKLIKCTSCLCCR